MTKEITEHEPLHSDNTRHISGQYVKILHKVGYSGLKINFSNEMNCFSKAIYCLNSVKGALFM